MLRSVKSTQRKMRQIEIVIQDNTADDTELVGTAKLKGPASNQVKSCKRDNATGVFLIELKQAFAAEPVIVGSNIDNTKGDDKKGGPSGDRIQIVYKSSSEKTSLIIVGSDVSSKI